MDKKLVRVYLYMNREKVMTKINMYTHGVVTFENYTDNPVYCAFGVKKSPVTVNDLYDLIEYRCFPRTRANADELLRDLGLTEYRPLEIIKTTYGVMFDDCFWIKLEGDDMTYDRLMRSFGFTWRYKD